MGQLLLFFLCNCSSFFSYVGVILVTNHFSLRYIFAIQQIIKHTRSICNLLNCLRSLGTMVITTQKVAKTVSKSFSLCNSSLKLPFFAVFIYVRYGHPKYFKFKRKYQHYDSCFQTIFPILVILQQRIYLEPKINSFLT